MFIQAALFSWVGHEAIYWNSVKVVFGAQSPAKKIVVSCGNPNADWCALTVLTRPSFRARAGLGPVSRGTIIAGLVAAGIFAAPSASFLMGSFLTGLLVLILWRYGLVAVFLIWVSPFLLLGALLTGFVLCYAHVPAFSASFRIPGNDATVRLEFFRTDGPQESGRYLTFTAPHGRISYNMPGWDWAHRARTSVYLTEHKNIAILGPDGENFLIEPDRLKVSRAFGAFSGDWTYLGAFDFVQPVTGGYDRDLRFIPATEQGPR